MARFNRIFISFAVEDKWARDYLAGQAKNAKTPFSFMDMSIKEPFDEQWKTKCRAIIKGCDGVIALLSSNTARANGAKWEMRCAVEERIPIIGIHVDSTSKAPVPAELFGKRIIEWTWDGIELFCNGL